MANIETLLLTGANNHDWTRSAPFCRDLLEGSGKFAVTLTEDPSSALEDAEALGAYPLIFSDYNGPEWSEKAKANFEAVVRGGTGLVILHAADNAFPGWVEYEKMVALLWREGTGHGAFHEFDVTVIDHEHPITRGLDDFRLWDELYHRLVRDDEPMMVVQQYGEGRVYHHVLGHVWPGDPEANKGCSMITFENPAFQNALLRGCEWAATGDVSD